MDAGVCTTCQHSLGQFEPDGMLGLFPRVRCEACGLVNVLTDGALAPSAVPAPRSETLAIDVAAFQEQPSIEEPPAFAAEEEPPAFAAAEESPGYEENADYEQPVSIGASEDYDQEVPEIPSEPTRVGNISEEDEE
jgi:hypothetical protein